MRRFLITLALTLFYSSTLVFAASGNIYIPHLKETTVLSTLLQAFFNPAEFFQKKVSPKNTDTLIRPLIPRAPNISPRVEEITPDGLCQVNTVRANPGDDLLGPKVNVNLTYTQKYEFDLPKNYREGCVESGRVGSPKSCCTAEANTETDKDGKTYWVCTIEPNVKMDTKGRMITGVNAPLLDKLDENLVGGKQSAVKRIYPQELTTEGKLEDIPAQANYTAQSIPGAVKESPKIYFPHLGAIYDYFMKGVQVVLRPFINTADVTPNLSGDCFTVAQNTDVEAICPGVAGEYLASLDPARICLANREMKKIIYSAADYAKVPPGILAGIISIESRNNVFKKYDTAEVAKHLANTAWTPVNCAANSCGAMGAMQMLTSYGVTNQCENQRARKVNNWAAYACKRDSNTNPNPGNLRDNIFAAARKVKADSGTTAGQNSNLSNTVVEKVAASYYGSCSRSFPGLGSTLAEANSCLTFIKTYPDSQTYCQYLVNYYANHK